MKIDALWFPARFEEAPYVIAPCIVIGFCVTDQRLPRSPRKRSLTCASVMRLRVPWPKSAMLLLEPDRWRRKVLMAIVVAGAAVGLYLLYFLVTEPIGAEVVGRHISYKFPHFYVAAVMTLYVLATCVNSLVSSCKTVRWLGAATFAALVAAYAIMPSRSFPSGASSLPF